MCTVEDFMKEQDLDWDDIDDETEAPDVDDLTQAINRWSYATEAMVRKADAILCKLDLILQAINGACVARVVREPIDPQFTKAIQRIVQDLAHEDVIA